MKFFNIPEKLKNSIREKAISQAKTRIIIAGKQPEDFSQQDLEIIVREEEDKIKGNLKEKGLLGIAALFGLGWWV